MRGATPLVAPLLTLYLPSDQFIYEYVGDVVSNASFKKRMRDYANEGIEHFYFMMLQKDEVRLLISQKNCLIYSSP